RIIHTLTHVSPPHVPKTRAPPGIFTKTVANETHPSLGVTPRREFCRKTLESKAFSAQIFPQKAEFPANSLPAGNFSLLATPPPGAAPPPPARPTRSGSPRPRPWSRRKGGPCGTW